MQQNYIRLGEGCSESAALGAGVSPSSLVPDMFRVLCWHSSIFLSFFKCLVLILLGVADFSLEMSIWNQKQQSLCTAQCMHQPVVYTRSVPKMLQVTPSSAPRLKSLCWRCVLSRSSVPVAWDPSHVSQPCSCWNASGADAMSPKGVCTPGPWSITLRSTEQFINSPLLINSACS